MRLLVVTFVSLFGMFGCYAPEKPVCTYACDPVKVGNGGHCPPDYECRTDGYCHLIGTTEACPFPAPRDLSVADQADQSMPPDMSTPSDL